MKQITIRISQREHDFLEEVAIKKDTTKSEILREAIATYKQARKFEQDRRELLEIKETCKKILQAQAFGLDNAVKNKILSLEILIAYSRSGDIQQIIKALMEKAEAEFKKYKSILDHTGDNNV